MRRKLALLALLILSACEAAPATTNEEHPMPLPTSRERTYIVGTPVDPNDMNAIMDQTTGKKYPSIYRWQGLHRAGLETNVAWDNGGGVYAGQLRSTGAMVVDGIVLDGFDVGTRITGLKVRCSGSGGAQTVHAFLSVGQGGVTFNIGDLAIVNPGADAVYTLDPLTTIHTLAEGEHLVLKLTTGLTAVVIASVGIGTDRL